MKKIRPGDVYGQLTVVKQVGFGKNPKYQCLCVCGITSLVWSSGLCNKMEGTKSCGCLHLKSTQKTAGYAAYGVLYTRAKKNAKIRRISFDISLDEYRSLAVKNCTYCGISPKQYNPYLGADGKPGKNRTQRSVDRSWIKANGVDRIDSLEGYTPTNCVTCCSQCNYSKLDYTVEEYLEHCHNVVRYQNSIKKAA